MELFGKIEAKVVTERGARRPQFIFHTDNFDQAWRALQLWYLSPLMIDLAMLRSLPIQVQGLPQDAGYRRLEWIFEDPAPEGAFEMYLSQDMTDKLAAANKEAQGFRLVLESNQGIFGPKKTEALDYPLHLLDWSGLSGVLFYLRNSVKPEGAKAIAQRAIPVLCKQLEAGEVAEATGLYTEIGYQFRMLGDWEQAVRYYRKEIELGLKHKPQISRGCLKALCNLGVVYKKQNNYSLAQKCFILALHLNPNYFEVLLSLAGIVNNLELTFLCLARSYRVRPKNQYVGLAIEAMCKAQGFKVEPAWNKVNQLAQEVDLTQRTPKLVIKDPWPYFQELGFR